MYILNRDNVSIINAILKEEKFNITARHRRITRCKRLRFASSKFGEAELLLHLNRYTSLGFRLI